MPTVSALPSDLPSEPLPYDRRVIRVVEAQHRVATNRLAASAEDQALLEALVDEAKPLLPPAAQSIPWLLASPFRYGYGRPSRFRSADTRPGILYASETAETAVAEAAHWRLVAFSRSPGFQRPATPVPMSAFTVYVRSPRVLDLTGAGAERWTHPTDYAPTQALGAVARAAGVAAIRAPSTRAADGVNLAVLDPAALVPPPRPHSSWAFLATPEGGPLAAREGGGPALRFVAVEPV